MKVKGKFKNITFDIEGNPIISLEVYEKNTLLREYQSFKDIDILDIEIKKHKNKRSLNANNYCWALINEIGNVLNMSKEEVYFQMLKRYGQGEVVSLLSKINVNGYFKHYEAIGNAVLNGKAFTHYKVYKGSSEFDTKEMSIFINGIVDEAKELGISTITPNELESLKNGWNASNS